MKRTQAESSVKQQPVTVRMLLDWLITGHVVETNPAHSVWSPNHVISKCLTPVLDAEETNPADDRKGDTWDNVAITAAMVERQNATDRNHNARKAHKTYRFSKDWRYHEALTYLTMYVYNFGWPVRTLRVEDDQGR